MEKFFTKILFFGSLSLLLMSISCKDKTDTKDEVSYTAFFKNVSENIIQPQYKDYLNNTTSFKESIQEFLNNPNEVNLDAARAKFKSNYKEWQKTALYSFGPAADGDILLNSNVNPYPTLENKIEANITGSGYDLESASNSFAKGLPAIEYLLYGEGKTKQEIVNSFSDSKRKEYLSKNIDLIESKIKMASDKWPAYHSTFISNKGTGKSSSLTLVFNAFLEDYEALKRNKFALPAGFATEFSVPIEANSKKIEGRFAKMSFELMLASLVAHRDFYNGKGPNGTDGIGFYEKLVEFKTNSTIAEGNLADAINKQFDIIEGNLNQYTLGSFATEIESNNPKFTETNTQLQKMVPMLKAELRSALSVPITGVDADGD
jgi:hypothetical protein